MINMVAGSKKILHTETLSNLVSSLYPDKFIQIPRLSIVNIDKIKGLKTDENGKYYVTIKIEAEFSLCRTFKGTFTNNFSTF